MKEKIENKIRILTNHPGQSESATWKETTTFIPTKKNDYLSALSVSIKLYCKRNDHDCVVLGAGRSNTFFALMQALIPKGKIKPCIMIDCLWYKSPNKFCSFLKNTIMRLADRSVDRYVVWARREIEAYSREFGLPRNKFVYIPYHTTLDAYHLSSIDNGYLFSGGNFSRDYKTLIESVRGLPIKLLIACTRPELFKKMDIPTNVTVQGFSHGEYLTKMAGCRINIVALAPGHLHSGGQQTFLNSMYLGKPTIVTDPEGACDYIENGRNGLLVEPGDVGALRNAIMFLLDNPLKASEMGREAREKVQGLSTEDHFQKVVALALEILSKKGISI